MEDWLYDYYSDILESLEYDEDEEWQRSFHPDGADEFHYHEVMHVALLIVGLWEDYITGNFAVKDNEELGKRAYEIGYKIAGFYQEAGAQSFYKFSGAE